MIGLSGGLDSVVLLAAMAGLRDASETGIELRAIHVNHQLQAEADGWEQHCSDLCNRLNIELVTTRVEVPKGSGLENAAREARYREFEATLQRDEELLLAHHRDDQMETLLLRLMRGSGSRGLSGIPVSRELGFSRLVRPLLDIDRAELQDYAETSQLSWIEDCSNLDERFDRNYCRHRLLPLIEARWPGYRESWSKSAALANESEALIRDLAILDLAQIGTASPSIVNRTKLLALSEPRRRNVLRHWLASLGASELGWNQLQQLSNEVLLNASGQFVGDAYQIFCFRECVYVVDALGLRVEPDAIDLASGNELMAAQKLALPDNGWLLISETTGGGICLDKLEHLSVRYRQGGESCELAGRPSKTLKKILQESEVPPWLRARIPLLYSGEDLACIPGVGVSAQFAAEEGESGRSVEWKPPELGFAR
ncbi:MAG: tRNA(Ile)-lysidine synthase [Pseudohongiella sp.]|nr:MAG: tRNA(Ile)-lysidine synthase [Pseudohongiella sp.]